MSGKVLITGGAGFIGFHLATRLVGNGYQVHVLDNLARGIVDKDLENLINKPEVSFSVVDLLEKKSLLALDKDYDFIFHLSALIGVKHVIRQPYKVLTQNTHMLENTIALSQQQLNLSRLLFASTSEVYAGTLDQFHLNIPTAENSPLAVGILDEPRTSYMLSKIMGETMCHHSGVPYTIFRPHNIYGPRMGMAHVIPEQLRVAFNARSGDHLDVYSLEHTRTFCFVDDAVAMLIRMIESDSCIGQTMNLGVETPEVTIREVVETCIRVTGKKLQINSLPSTPGSPKRRVPDMRLAKSLLGYESQGNLREGITKTWEWYRKNVFENCGRSAE